MIRRRRRPKSGQPPTVAADPDTTTTAAAAASVDDKDEEAIVPTSEETTEAETHGSVTSDVIPWGNSTAKEHLKSLLQDETSWLYTVWKKPGSQASRIEEIRNRSPLFQKYAKNLFYTNFRNLKGSVDVEKTAVLFDQMAFDKEQGKWPINEALANGKPRWQDSDAQKQLREDLKDPDKKNYKPRQFYFDDERQMYRAWSLDEFRNFLYEEKKWETQGVYWQAQRNKDMRKKAVQTVDAGEWGAEHET